MYYKVYTLYMIRWNQEKAEILKNERGIDMREVAFIIEQGDFIDIVESPSQERHPGQSTFVIRLNGYVHLVPFVIEETGDIFIKTVFPSRRMNEIYKER